MRRMNFFPAAAGILPLLLFMQTAGAADSPGSVRNLKAVRPYREPEEVIKHRQRILKVYAAQDERLKKADELLKQKKYKEALGVCEEVIAELELELASVKSHAAQSRLDAVRKQAADIRHQWGADLLGKARLAAADKRYDDCILIAVQAAEVSPDHKEEANALADHGRGMKRADKKRDDVSLKKAAPSREEQRKAFERLIAEAKTYLRNGKLTTARETVEKAFVIDPYDSEAISLAGEVYRQLFNAAAQRRKSTFAAVMAFAAWQWSEPTFNLVSASRIPRGEKRNVGADSEKLKNIRFAGFHFDDADLPAVLTYIQDRSKEGDPEKDERYKGVSVGHMLTPELADKIRVTLSLDNVSLASVLECLSLVTGLKYEVSTRNNYTSINFAPLANEMIRHSWDTPRNFYQVVTGKEPASVAERIGGDSGETAGPVVVPKVGDDATPETDDDPGKGLEGRQNTDITREELQNYFSERGVDFPPGSSIYYSSRTNKLTATNTRENIFKLDERIDQIAAAVKPLVMIELKAFEISENDYQDLGFDWTLGTIGKNISGSEGQINGDGWLLGPGVNALPNNPLAMLRGGTADNDSKTAVINNWNIFPSLFGSKNPFGSDIPLNISLTVNALARSDRTETLTAPKVVTQDGQAGTVSMTTTYYFPTSWDEIEIEVNSTDSQINYSITPPQPEFSDDGESLGIKFTVVPKVYKNRNIELKINLSLSSYVGPDNYEVTATIRQNVGTLLEPKTRTTTQTYTIWRPIESQRALDTVVEVTDGETLVLGGMVENHAITRVDKVPILGELPLIGRFFQSQAENMDRANLLVFVTARLIDDHGVPIKRNFNNGLPEFNR
ncbi:MAG: hypothetical protein IJS01_10765 [Lentisphaeria bacterium]|nr:hypothetical protein [Lentisphaeria bacterium]